MCFASVEGDFQMGFVRHIRSSEAMISVQLRLLFQINTRYFLEISLNSCLIRLDQLSMACTGKIPQEICFKYNIFDTIRRVFFRGSMASNISLGLDAGSPSSSFGWPSFFFLFFFFGRGDYCCLFFIVYFFSLFFCLFVLFFLYSCSYPISDLHKVLWYTYFSLSGMISHD